MAINVGETAIKYTLTDKNAETIKINENHKMTRKLFESLNEIIHSYLNQIDGIALLFRVKLMLKRE